MKLKVQKRLAADVLKCSSKKIVFDTERTEEIKSSITKNDIRKLVKDYAIIKRRENAPSRVRARKIMKQRSKGKRKGAGSRKGKETARTNKKDYWMAHVRKQRAHLKNLKDKGKLQEGVYRVLYRKIKGGFFRSLRHMKMYIQEQKMIKNE